ncbi:class I SAM-dependent methyltransferase [Hydromonas duriensis]|nr:SAM-dependent methyltransferase [Hydromonas duriensis]
MCRHCTPYNASKKVTPMAQQLPQPSTAQLARSEQLMSVIHTLIHQAHGWLPFDAYMNAALYTPRLGYYASETSPFSALAADGDFITAPLLSPEFGACIAEQALEVFERVGVAQILEVGAGTGRLAADILTHLHNRGVQVNYAILELSGTLRAQQQATLADAGVHLSHQVRWLDALPEDYEGFIIGNEVLDAMPVELIGVQAGQWFERGVTADAQGLEYVDRPTDKRLTMPKEWLTALEDSGATYVSETHCQQLAFIESLGACLKKGVVLMLDYGFPAHEFYHPQRNTGTLMCHIQHVAHDDALYCPGVQDITAHVNFSALKSPRNLTAIGYVNQANFLINCGLLELLTQLPEEHMRVAANRAHKLISEAEMGELFKAMAWAKGLAFEEDDTLQGFTRGNRLLSL